MCCPWAWLSHRLTALRGNGPPARFLREVLAFLLEVLVRGSCARFLREVLARVSCVPTYGMQTAPVRILDWLNDAVSLRPRIIVALNTFTTIHNLHTGTSIVARS